MDLFRHHAYILAGNIELLVARITEVLADAGISFIGNPDVITVFAESLSIDDARTIFERTRTSVPEHARRIVLVSCTQATVEAQNALLKITEEPPRRTHFFFFVPNEGVLLPTLQSRLQPLHRVALSEKSTPNTSLFLKSSFSERMAVLEPFIEEKRHTEALQLCNTLEQELTRDSAKNQGALRILETVRLFILRRGSSLKLVLEYLALSIPRRT